MMKTILNRPGLVIVVLLLAALSAPGCRYTNWTPGNLNETYEEPANTDIPSSGITTLRVAEINGGIIINFSDDKIIRVQAVKVVKSSTQQIAKESAAEFKIVMQPKGSTFEVFTKYPDFKHNRFSGWVNFTVTAPRGMNVVAETVNSPITIGPGAGSASASSVSGAISIAGINGGNLKANTTNGNIKISECTGPLFVDSVNGAIDFFSVSPPAGDMLFKTVNGDIHAIVPDTSDLAVNASTINGEIKSNIILSEKAFTQKSLSGNLNSGKFKMLLSTVNAPIDLEANEKNTK